MCEFHLIILLIYDTINSKIKEISGEIVWYFLNTMEVDCVTPSVNKAKGWLNMDGYIISGAPRQNDDKGLSMERNFLGENIST